MRVYIKISLDTPAKKLKYHQHTWDKKLRSEISISLEIILNVFKCPPVSHFPLKLVLW